MLSIKGDDYMVLSEYVKEQIWICEYPVRYSGIDLFGRMTVIRLQNGDLLIHDPCQIDENLKSELATIGNVKYIIAPGSYHHLFVKEFQSHYPNAETYLCPGLERKRPDIPFHWILGNEPDPRWNGEIELVVVQGTKYIWEVPFFHKASGTLILVDLLENIGDSYQHQASWHLMFWWKLVFRMWNNPKAAPEYQIGWGDKKIVRIALKQVLAWKPERIILAHGEIIEKDIEDTLIKAWAKILRD
jgi:hypothetical protein